MKKVILFLLSFLLLIPASHAQIECVDGFPECYLADNPFDALMDGETHNWRLEVSGIFPAASESSTFNQRAMYDDMPPYITTINVAGTETPVKSYLYISTSNFYLPSSEWTVTLNGVTLAGADDEHTSPIGGKVRGDGPINQERQTLFFDVTGLVNPGDNSIKFSGVSTTISYRFNGAVILNFYPSEDEHQFWVYHGVEYLEHSGLEDSTYVQAFLNPDYTAKSDGTLYTVYNNPEEAKDELYFNDNLLKDSSATYLLDGSNIISKSFDVSRYLDNSDSAKFTIEKYQPEAGKVFIQREAIAIYPSLAILDVKLPPKPKVVVLANSIDGERASDFFGFLRNRGLDVIHATAENFDQYKTQKFIVILGGPDAPEGIGDLIQAEQFNLKLKADEIDYIRQQGNKRKLHRSSVWTAGQSVWIIAGANRELTKEAHSDNRAEVANTVETESQTEETETDTTTTDPCPPSEANPLTHVLGFESIDARGDVYICEVIYSEDEDNWRITLYNQGEELVSLKRYKLTDSENRWYPFNNFVDADIAAGGYYTLNANELATSTIRLGNMRGSIVLTDDESTLIDKVEWDNF